MGKTELAKAVATARGARLIRLQCYEGVDEASRTLRVESRQTTARITAARQDDQHQGHESPDSGWDAVRDDIFTDEFLLARPLLAAIRSPEPVVLLIDRLDKADVEIEDCSSRS